MDLTSAFGADAEHPEGARIEYRFTPAAGGTLSLAGLRGWADPAEGRTPTFTMVTKDKGPDTASIGRHRQPMKLAEEQLAEWMDPANPILAFTEISSVGSFKVEATPPRPKSAGNIKSDAVTNGFDG